MLACGSEPTTLHAPAPTALEQQQASIQVQRDSVEKQLSTVRPVVRMSTQQHNGQAVRTESLSFTNTSFEPLNVPAFSPEEAPFLPPTSLDCPTLPLPEADSLIASAAQHEAISPALLRAVIKRESGFHPCAISDKGALGLMQLMPATAQQFGVDDPFNPRQNVFGGAAFLKQLLNRFGGDTRLALGAYNAGPERVEAAGGIPSLEETQNYVSAIAHDLELPEPLPPNPPKEIVNAMTKPDLRHLTLTSAALQSLASPTLPLQPPATPAHLISGQ